MSRSLIQTHGSIVYRTSLLTSARAASFARLLRGNSRFERVDVKHSDRAKSERAFFVTFEPSSDARKDTLFMAQWHARKAKGENEGAEYIFWPDPDHDGEWWCFNPLSGETYQVSIFRCSCPDYEFRCQKAGILCKHQQAWSAQKAAGTIGQTDKRAA